jgi:leucyl aminopeptidase
LHIVGLVPATDNRPGENAYVPGDIIQMMSGAFVEVLNTDAEGRMILADALHHAKSFQPSLVLDFATLTGAAAMATGTQAAVYYCHGDEQLRQQVQKSAFEVFERVVEFPLWDDYADLLKSDVADMKNIGGPYAGSITAAKFLQYFTEYNWLHFDIAGVAFLMKEEGYRTKGGNPFGIRLVYDFLKQQAEG